LEGVEKNIKTNKKLANSSIKMAAKGILKIRKIAIYPQQNYRFLRNFAVIRLEIPGIVSQ